MRYTKLQIPGWREEGALDYILRLKADGLTAQEISKIFGVTKNAVRKRLQAARLKMPSSVGLSSIRGKEQNAPEAKNNTTKNKSTKNKVAQNVASVRKTKPITPSQKVPEIEAPKKDLKKDIVGASSGRGVVFDIGTLSIMSGCHWPLWPDSQKPDFQFCGKTVARNRWPHVYCEDCLCKAFSRSGQSSNRTK